MRKIFKILLILFFLYVFVGFLILPHIIRYLGEARLRDKVDAAATIEKIRVNPLAFSISVEGLSIPNESGVWGIRYAAGSANLSIRSLFKFHAVFDSISLNEPIFRFTRMSKEGSVDENTEMSEAKDLRTIVEEINALEIPAVSIDVINVNGGSFDFRDTTNAQAFTQTLHPISFFLENFTTESGDDHTMVFSAEFDSGAILKINATLGSVPISSSGNISLMGFEVNTLSPYFAQFIQFDLEKAVFNFDMDYVIDFSNYENLATFNVSEVSLADISCRSTNRENQIFSIGLIQASDTTFKFPDMNLNVGSLLMKDGETKIHRNAGGEINLLNLVTSRENTLPAVEPIEDLELEPKEGQVAQFSYMFDQILLENYSIVWEDVLASGLASLQVEVSSVSVSELSSEFSEPLSVVANFVVEKEGKLQVEGSITPETSHTDLKLNIESLPLHSASNYTSEFANIEIQSGAAFYQGSFLGSVEKGFGFEGSGRILDLSVIYADDQTNSIQWKALAFDGLKVVSNPVALSVSSIDLENPDVVYLFKPKVENTTAAQLGNETVSSTTEGGEEAIAPKIEVDVFNLRGGNFEIIDSSISPAVDFVLSELELTVKEFGLISNSLTSINLESRLNSAALSLNGVTTIVDPSAQTDFDLQISGLELPELSSYSSSAIGRRIDKGWLEFQSDFNVVNNQLKADNKIKISDFQLGERVESENATNLPLDLAVVLLKGPSGVMDLSLPLSGDLSDPKAGIGQIVRTAFVGLVTSVASSPFKLLSGLTDSEVDLSFLEFEIGEGIIESAGIDQLNTLAKALKERPAIRLEITPVFSASELEVLKRKALSAYFGFEGEVSAKYEARVRKEFQKNKAIESENSLLTLEEMESALLVDIDIPLGSLNSLEEDRVDVVRGHLINSQGINEGRVFTGTKDVKSERSGIQFDLQ